MTTASSHSVFVGGNQKRRLSIYFHRLADEGSLRDYNMQFSYPAKKVIKHALMSMDRFQSFLIGVVLHAQDKYGFDPDPAVSLEIDEDDRKLIDEWFAEVSSEKDKALIVEAAARAQEVIRVYDTIIVAAEGKPKDIDAQEITKLIDDKKLAQIRADLGFEDGQHLHRYDKRALFDAVFKSIVVDPYPDLRLKEEKMQSDKDTGAELAAPA